MDLSGGWSLQEVPTCASGVREFPLVIGLVDSNQGQLTDDSDPFMEFPVRCNKQFEMDKQQKDSGQAFFVHAFHSMAPKSAEAFSPFAGAEQLPCFLQQHPHSVSLGARIILAGKFLNLLRFRGHRTYFQCCSSSCAGSDGLAVDLQVEIDLFAPIEEESTKTKATMVRSWQAQWERRVVLHIKNQREEVDRQRNATRR